MSLTPTTRLGPYEIQAAIGTGGMGEVYRARDTRLKRDVALKILPELFAADPERLARFQREAEVLASLNHPNIAAIHGLEESDGFKALVMELVEGPTLADRVAQEPIPVEEALPIARQIADALEAAHERSIIHRDLKPANIKVRADGTVKVLDFGLAKALERPAAGRVLSPAGSEDPTYTRSPTITSPVTMTGVGVLLGTAAYMSPEQARGKAVDTRSDIWAFGCVVYEMLTGRSAFVSEDVTDTLAFIITREPDWNLLPASTPAALRSLLQHCLEKDRTRRLRHIGDARLAIDDALAPAPVSPTDVRPAGNDVQRVGWRRYLPWGVAAALASALAVVVVSSAPWRTSAPLPPVRLEAGLGAPVTLDRLNASLAVSPDGSFLVFSGRSGDGIQQLYIRSLGELRAIPLPGTSNARNPFFSPDGQWIGFFADSSLKKIAITGGAAVALSPAGDDRGGWWAEDGSIVFQPSGSGAGLSRVSSAGGTPATVTTLGTGEVTHRWPQVVPGGHAILYTAHSSIAGFDDAVIVVQPLPDGPPKIVQRGGYYGRYLPSGHLVYIHQGTLFAEPFDLARLEPTGQPVPVIEGVSTYTGLTGVGGQAGSAQVAWTETGTAIYLAGQEKGGDASIEWIDRAGRVMALRTTRAAWGNPQFSPDGGQLAVDIVAGRTDVFTYDWARDTVSRVTFGSGLQVKPVWTPDGRRVVFRSTRETGVLNLYWQRADGSGDVQRLTESPNPQFTGSWHPSGKFLAFYEGRPASGIDLMILPMEGDEASGWKPGKPTVFLSTTFNEAEPTFSPDGRWIAYHSNETGNAQVYVRPFPGPGGRWQVSTDGGTYPTWSRKRQELVYAAPDNRLMVATYTVEGESFKADRPRVWSERRFITRPGRSFDLHPDGERVALAAAPENETVVEQDTLVVILNFFDELRRVVPAAAQ